MPLTTRFDHLFVDPAVPESLAPPLAAPEPAALMSDHRHD
jgi:hypothetical protein